MSTTYRNHKKEVADNVSNHNALYRRITDKGRIREYESRQARRRGETGYDTLEEYRGEK